MIEYRGCFISPRVRSLGGGVEIRVAWGPKGGKGLELNHNVHIEYVDPPMFIERFFGATFEGRINRRKAKMVSKARRQIDNAISVQAAILIAAELDT